MLVNVIFPYKWSKLYTYETKVKVPIGQIVLAPLRGKMSVGVVLEHVAHSDLLNISKLDTITNYNISPVDLKWMEQVAKYNMSSFQEILGMYLSKKSYNIAIDEYYYKDTETGHVYSVSYIMQNLGKRLMEKELKQGKIEPCTLKYNFKNRLSPAQEKISADIEEHARISPAPILLRGPTGCGKTGIYLRFAELFLRQGKQVLILMPEVALTRSFSEMVLQVFDFAPHVWNHKTHKVARERIWEWAWSGISGILLGSRSAIWLPFSNLGCIIIDEEHDLSYKQDVVPMYHGRDMAVLRANHNKCHCLLVSATPSVESWSNVTTNKYRSVEMTGYQSASITIVKKPGTNLLSPELKEAMTTTLTKNQQVMLFLNRRGFAPHVVCNSCNHQLLCKYCSATLTFYRNSTAHCSYCGYRWSMGTCSTCGSTSWDLNGAGIERIEEEVKKSFHQAVIMTCSSDTNQISRLIEMVSRNQVDIVITTQVLSKGYTFPNLTLVGVIHADQGIKSGDPRNNEKIYQLLTQIKGRCGRTGLESKVIMQASNPQDKLLEAIVQNDFLAWVKAELDLRKTNNLPPFWKLIRIIVTSKSTLHVLHDSKIIYEQLKLNTSYITYPPAPALLYKQGGKFRYSIIVRYQRQTYPQLKLKSTLEQVRLTGKSIVSIDVDPYNFL